jgi:hypothetical protein
MVDEREASRNAETIYAPANARTKSASELYREASAVQADAMRTLASQLESARQHLGRAPVFPTETESEIARAAVLVHGVERALLLIAAELVRHD